jgi:hypothetical protein
MTNIITNNSDLTSRKLKIYFAASITGGRDNVEIYLDLISHLKKYGEVLTEHVGSTSLSSSGETDKSLVHERDMNWLLSADVVVAEVSMPSLGVGYELGRAVERNKKILCLYRKDSPKKLSGMISGNKHMVVYTYATLDEAKSTIDGFFKQFKSA